MPCAPLPAALYCNRHRPGAWSRFVNAATPLSTKPSRPPGIEASLRMISPATTHLTGLRVTLYDTIDDYIHGGVATEHSSTHVS